MQKERLKRYITAIGVAMLLTGCIVNAEPYKANITVIKATKTGTEEIFLENCEVISEDFLGTVTFKDSGGEEYMLSKGSIQIEKVDETEEYGEKDMHAEGESSDVGACEVGASGCE